jgi:poly-gamma-glutamate capsule biosynthesis protein CapA/YwtB (metallophosphatase superfamily)
MSDVPPPQPVFQASEASCPPGGGSLLFAGDCFLGPGTPPRGIRSVHQDLACRIADASCSVVNLESAIEGAGERRPKDGPHIACGKAAPALLKALGFDVLLLANNHIMDFGVEGLEATVEEIRSCGLQFTGAEVPPHIPDDPVTAVLPGGERVHIFDFCEREFGTNADGGPGACWLGPRVAARIRRARESGGIVVVCSHGGNELVPVPSMQRRAQLRGLVEAGADLVIGHHSHVPQGWEIWRHGCIFYSLGDFYFDSLNGLRDSQRDWSFLVEVRVAAGRISQIGVIPYERVSNELVPLGASRNAALRLAYLQRLSKVVASDEFPGYWQEFAMLLLAERYQPYFRNLLPGIKRPGLSAWRRVKGSVKAALNSLDYFGLAWFSDFRQPQLSLLNLMRCESHRWVMETALAVLCGEAEDLRTPKIRQEVAAIRHFQNTGEWLSAQPARVDELSQCVR